MSGCDWKSHQKAWYAIKSMENHTNFSSLEITPSFPYETDKIYGNGYLEMSVSPLTSALKSACEYNYSLLHSVNHL